MYSMTPPSMQTDAAPLAMGSREQLHLPNGVIVLLERPESKENMSAALIGIIGAVLISVFLTFLASRGIVFAKLFDLRSATGYIPMFILVMALWSVAWSVLRAQRIQALGIACASSLVFAAVRFLEHYLPDPAASAPETPANALLTAIASLQGNQVSPVLVRLSALLHQWQLETGLTQADLVLQYHLYQDEEKITKAYSLMRTFVWAMPVVGLIGTVVGIALAVGGFASFLSGGVDDIEKIKLSLIHVTQGLSFSFMITMLGLVGALIAMLLISWLQTREERIIEDAQKQITDIFLPALQRAMPVAGPVSNVGNVQTTAIEHVLDVLKVRMTEVVKEISDAGKTMAESMVQAARDGKTLAEEMKVSIDTIAQSMVLAARNGKTLAEEMKVSTETLAQSMVQTAKDGKALAEEMKVSTETLARSMVKAAEDGKALADDMKESTVAIIQRTASETQLQFAGVAESATLVRSSLHGAAEDAAQLREEVKSALTLSAEAHKRELQQQIDGVKNHLSALVNTIGQFAESETSAYIKR